MDHGQGPGSVPHTPRQVLITTKDGPPTLAICIPSSGDVPSEFAQDLMEMSGVLGACVANDNYFSNYVDIWVRGTYVHSARQQLAEKAMDVGADYVLWLDDDMRFPKDLAIRLLARNEAIVGVNYSTRKGAPCEFTAISRITGDDGTPSKRCETLNDSTGLEPVEAIGFGAVLIRADVFRALHDPNGPDGPWFWYRWMPELNQQVGEDVYFCELVRKAGFTIYVDHDLSHEVAHIGKFGYRCEHAEEFVETVAEVKRIQAVK